ncbi:MAG: hypothetical protein IJQ85_02185, partial [Selenomonadaceae bacterium]|nr:hypothetical protein [Selenomonadaceae bacterium]
KENSKDIPKGHLCLKIFAVETAEEAFKKIFAEPIDFFEEQKSSAPEEKISLTKDEQIKKISSTTVTPEELEQLGVRS